MARFQTAATIFLLSSPGIVSKCAERPEKKASCSVRLPSTEKRLRDARTQGRLGGQRAAIGLPILSDR